MAYLTWVVRIILFLLMLGFAVRNLDAVRVRGFLGYEWNAPLILVLLVVLVAGVVLGTVGTLRTALALRRREPDSASATGPVAIGPARPAGPASVRELPADDQGA